MSILITSAFKFSESTNCARFCYKYNDLRAFIHLSGYGRHGVLQHMHAAKRVLRYLQGTSTLGITYRPPPHKDTRMRIGLEIWTQGGPRQDILSCSTMAPLPGRAGANPRLHYLQWNPNIWPSRMQQRNWSGSGPSLRNWATQTANQTSPLIFSPITRALLPLQRTLYLIPCESPKFGLSNFH